MEYRFDAPVFQVALAKEDVDGVIMESSLRENGFLLALS